MRGHLAKVLKLADVVDFQQLNARRFKRETDALNAAVIKFLADNVWNLRTAIDFLERVLGKAGVTFPVAASCEGDQVDAQKEAS